MSYKVIGGCDEVGTNKAAEREKQQLENETLKFFRSKATAPPAKAQLIDLINRTINYNDPVFIRAEARLKKMIVTEERTGDKHPTRGKRNEKT